MLEVQQHVIVLENIENLTDFLDKTPSRFTNCHSIINLVPKQHKIYCVNLQFSHKFANLHICAQLKPIENYVLIGLILFVQPIRIGERKCVHFKV